MRGVGASTRTWEIIDSVSKVENPLMRNYIKLIYIQFDIFKYIQ